MLHTVFRVIVLSTLLLHSACTALRDPTQPGSETTSPSTKNTPFNPASVEKQLLKAAQSIEQSLGVLAAAEQSENPPILNTAPLKSPEGGMGGRIDLEWTGPLGPLVQKIAQMSDYHLKFLGKEPAIPILISISAHATPIADILENAILQAGKKAAVLVFPQEKVIEVRYFSS